MPKFSTPKLLATVLLVLSGCSGSSPSAIDAGLVDAGPSCNPAPDAGEFIALLSDLQDYKTWQVFVLPDGETGQGVRHVYANHLPSPGSCAFPVGTILVKDAPPIGSAGTEQIDAMIKRGGGFNDGGASGWEWMGLTNPINDGESTIAWRGTQPPPNAGYGPNNSACNACHMLAAANDFVQMPPDDAGMHIAAPLRLGAN